MIGAFVRAIRTDAASAVASHDSPVTSVSATISSTPAEISKPPTIRRWEEILFSIMAL